MREIWCHMFKAGFKSLRGIKIIKVFSLLLAVLWKNYKWLNHLCWSETTVGKWKESGFLSTKQGGKRLHYHSVSLRSVMLSLPQIPGPRPSEALWRGVCLMCKNQNWKRDSQTWLMIIIPWSAFWKEQISRLLPWKFWFSRCRLESRNMNVNTCPYVGVLRSTRTGGHSLVHTFYRWVDWGLARIINILIPILKVSWG